MTWDRGAGVLPTTHRFMTAAEYYAMPEGLPYFQLIEGELFMSPSPNFFHQNIIGNLYLSIGAFLKKNKIGKVVLSPSDVELDEKNIYQPDLYYVRKERLSLFTKQGLKAAPDLAIEVISTSTARLDRGKKKANFARRGTLEFWAVVPKTKRVEVWKLAESVEEPACIRELGQTMTSELLPGWEMPVAEIFEE